MLSFVKASFPSYQAGWVHADLCARLEKFSAAVAAKQSPRLMIWFPPRHGKSIIASERFPVWHLGKYPDHQIVATTYGQQLSNKFSKRAHGVATSDMMRETFPDFRLDPSRQAVEEWLTMQGGGYRAAGIGGALTGTGADILLIDDPVKNAQEANSQIKRDSDWEWYGTTAYTRLMPGGGIIIIMTRWHQDDLAGRLIKAMETDDGDYWEVVCYPAIAEKDEEHRKIGEALHPERYPLQRLHRIRKAIKERPWQALYQQNPTPPEGNLVKKTWWKYFEHAPTRFDRLIFSWDCTFKDSKESDNVAGFLIGKAGADKYILDRVFWDQADFVVTQAAVKSSALAHPKARPILVEDKANGPAIISSLKNKIAGIVGFTPDGSKEARAAALSPEIEAGNWHLPATRNTSGELVPMPWVESFIEEWAQFPRGKNDDQVDAISQAGIYFSEDGKQCVFENLHQLFGEPETYVYGNRVCVPENHTAAYVGVKWGTEHTFIAIDSNGEMIGAHSCDSLDGASVVGELRGFARQLECDRVPVVIVYEATGAGEAFDRLIKADRKTMWRPVPLKLPPGEINAQITSLKADVETDAIAPRNWAPLYDQMAQLRAEEGDKGVRYAAPEGLHFNAVTALALAAHGKRTKGVGIGPVGVIDQIKIIQEIYQLED